MSADYTCSVLEQAVAVKVKGAEVSRMPLAKCRSGAARDTEAELKSARPDFRDAYLQRLLFRKVSAVKGHGGMTIPHMVRDPCEGGLAALCYDMWRAAHFNPLSCNALRRHTAHPPMC